MKQVFFFWGLCFLFHLTAYTQEAFNPIIFADVPDMSMIRVGRTYYMSSTTMHLSPGVPIMRSYDLTNWKIVNYAYDTLASVDDLNLDNGKSTYGRGSWASSLRYRDSIFYVSTFAQTTGKTYIFSTKDIEKGPWNVHSFKPAYHDHTLFFDDDGRVYMIYGAGKLKLIELSKDLSGLKPGTTEQVIIENADLPAGSNIGLHAEGSQLFKINGTYYLFNIVWPKGGVRTVLIHRSDKISGPWEGRVALQDRGIAQGGMIDSPEGKWYAYLFRDYGAVGRIPYISPVTWEDGWPVIGINNKIPDSLELAKNLSPIPGLVNSDEFTRTKGDPDLPLVWQWNHNPDNTHWSVHSRKGFLRITTSRIDTSFYLVKNIVGQRTFGPSCSGSIAIHTTHMKDGDVAGLTLFQKKYGYIGVKLENGKKQIIQVAVDSDIPMVKATIPFNQNTLYLKSECDFKELKDEGRFYYSLDNKTWILIGSTLKLKYTLPHFMGYRFGLFNYATKYAGGYVDFDWFRISSNTSDK